jgi:hypothetical protein
MDSLNGQIGECMKQSKNKINKSKNSMIMAAVAIVCIAVFAIYGLNNKSNAETTNVAEDTQDTEVTVQTAETSGVSASDSQAASVSSNEEGNIVIKTSDIGEDATFYQYEANGTTMEFFAVKASDGTIRTALNTCQVCNGSPYAYFDQQGDNFQCQNCGNIFQRDMIELEKSGCNPIPITSEVKTVTDTEITIPATFFDEKVDLFKNWKKF